MAKYDYIKLRVSESERKQLEEMVKSGGVSSLSDAVRKLAFADNSDNRETLNRYLQEVAGAHQALAGLVRNWTPMTKLTDEDAYSKLVEADIVAMEREVHKLVKSAAKLSRELRRVM